MRFAAVEFPAWPITAAGYCLDQSVAVLESGSVSVCSPAAYADGVRVGQRRREAKRRSPTMAVLTHDPYRDFQAFEPFIKGLTAVVPRLEITRPGLITLGSEGPSRYYGSELKLQELLISAAQPAVARVGIADTRFAAALAAHQNLIVAAGQTREFLEPFPITTLGLDDLTLLSRRLGLYTLGQFAALPSRAVLTRFGSAAAAAHLLARGNQSQPLSIYEPTEPLVVEVPLDPPAERVDIATFAARAMASDLIEMLNRRGLACTQLLVQAETEHAELLSRSWRGSPVFDAETIVERVRWQLSGWLDAGGDDPQPTAGISLLKLHAEEVAGTSDLQVSLWGELSETDRRAVRGLDRVRGLLGPNGVFTAVLRGGRGPGDQTKLIPWGEPIPSPEVGAPWPGRLPAPSPSLLYPQPVPIEVVGDSGPVGVSVRGEVSQTPTGIRLPRSKWLAITGWAGPWLSDEQWWDPQTHNRCARFQILTAGASAHLCVVRQNHWFLEATYD